MPLILVVIVSSLGGVVWAVCGYNLSDGRVGVPIARMIALLVGVIRCILVVNIFYGSISNLCWCLISHSLGRTWPAGQLGAFHTMQVTHTTNKQKIGRNAQMYSLPCPNTTAHARAEQEPNTHQSNTHLTAECTKGRHFVIFLIYAFGYQPLGAICINM